MCGWISSKKCSQESAHLSAFLFFSVLSWRAAKERWESTGSKQNVLTLGCLQICISRRLKEHQRNLESCYMFIPALSHGHQTLIPTGPGRAKCACSRDSRKHLDGKIQVVGDFAHGQIHPRRHRRRHRPRLSLKVAWLASPRLTVWRGVKLFTNGLE
jgi:hypothetical protein